MNSKLKAKLAHFLLRFVVRSSFIPLLFFFICLLVIIFYPNETFITLILGIILVVYLFLVEDKIVNWLYKKRTTGPP
jgi:hypothetical protein